MEFNFDLFAEDFIQTILKDIEDNDTPDRKKYFLVKDIKDTIYSKLNEFKDNIIIELKESIDQEQCEYAYDKGYDEGYEAALDEVSDSIDKIKIWMTRGRV